LHTGFDRIAGGQIGMIERDSVAATNTPPSWLLICNPFSSNALMKVICT
jgi:hypothetical protein